MADWMYAIEKTVVERRDFITRIGRRIQDDLDIPKCLHIFTKEDPGIPADVLRIVALMLSVVYFVAFLVAVSRPPSVYTIWDPWFLGMGVVTPTCMTVLLWFFLALVRRRRSIELREGRPERKEEDFGTTLLNLCATGA